MIANQNFWENEENKPPIKKMYIIPHQAIHQLDKLYGKLITEHV